ncbi:putative ribonuclease H-like domain-containing protein [Tanacetum coccineum]
MPRISALAGCDIPLATKLPVIIEYKLHKEGMLIHYELIKADRSSKRYSSMIRMLQGIDREYLEALWRIVKGKYGDIRPEDEFERVLYGDLRVMFEPDIKSDVWRMLQDAGSYPYNNNYIIQYVNKKTSNDHQRDVLSAEAYGKAAKRKMKVTAAQVRNRSRIGINKWYQSLALRNFDLEDMELESTNSGPTAKLPILKLGEYEMWAMRIKQYFQIQDYALWEVIENGDSWVPISQTTEENGITTSKVSTPATAEEKIKRKNDVKARGLLLMALPNEHQLTFSQYPDAKSMFAAIETRFGGNAATKKTQKTLLKQQYENFSATSAESLDSIFNRLQKILDRVSVASPSVNTASPQVCTASVSDNTVYAFMVENPNGSNVLHQDLEQIHEDDLEAMDLKWQLSLLSVRAKKYYQKTGKKIFINSNDIAGYDKSKVECYNCHKLGHFARECRASRSKEDQFRNQDNTRKQGNKEDTSKAMLAIDGVGFDWSEMAEEQVQSNMALMAFSDSEVYTDKTCSKTCLNNYETLKKQYDDLLAKQLQTKFESATYKRGLDTVEAQLVTYRKNEVLFSEEVAVLKREVEFKQYEINTLKAEFEKLKKEKDNIDFKIEKFDKASKDLDQLLGSQITDKSKKGFGYSANLNFKSYVPENSKKESNIVKESDNSKENSDKSLVKELESQVKVDLLKVNTVRPRIVNTARSYRTPVNTVRPRVINTARQNRTSVNAARANGFNAGKPQHDDKGFVDSGCSRHMTGNIAYLSDFKQFDGGYVAFGGGAYGGKISSKGTLKTANLDFEDVYFVNELKFNLFSVSQMCDKKNYVLFTDTECLVLSPNFKLPDENQILLKVPRKDNMYSFDMKNIVPKESLTCLVAKATLDESMLWHRRLGHINFKNINKLVKDNLVRGLPTKRFENDQTCVACLKGKQHRTSCKSKVLNPITKPLFMLHMDLFGPTFVSSLMHKKYCLVVTDDYSRFTWVFFLTTKDETSEILKRFIKEIENLVDKKVKIIRSDNGTEFKNKVVDDFCREKGIKREYSVARTPQQNGVAGRRNMTLIEAARTMVLVVKPHNKTPYELFRGFKPALSFMRPFGCHVTILNTLDSLGKFDGKSDEGFFVGYSLSSKAFRVYNTRTKRVEENLHIGFLENKPMIEGTGPKWLFDIDSLTQSMNYVPVTAGTVSNNSVGTSEENSQECIMMPIWKDSLYFDSPTKNVDNDEPKTADDAQKQDEDGLNNENDEQERFENDSSSKDVNAVGQQVNTASPNVNTGSIELNVVGPSVSTASSNEEDNTEEEPEVNLRSRNSAIQTLTVFGSLVDLDPNGKEGHWNKNGSLETRKD